MIDGKPFLISQLKVIREYMITFEKYQLVKEMITQLDFLLYDNYFNNYYKMVAIDLSKQQALDSDPKAIQQITFAGNIEKNALIVFIIEETK